MTPNKLLIASFFFLGLNSMVVGQNVGRQLMQDFPRWIDEQFENTHPDAKVLGNGLFRHTAPITEQYSEANDQFAGTRDGRLYVRNHGSDSLLQTFAPKDGRYWTMSNAMWSPSGDFLAAKQVDDRAVPEIQLSSTNPPETIQQKYSRAGQAIPEEYFNIIHIHSGKMVEIERDPDLPYVHLLQWSSDGEQLYFLMSSRLLNEVHLKTVDVKSGRQTTLLTETSETYVIGLDLLQGYSNRLIDHQQIVFFEDRGQFIWQSERSGFNQVYLYDDQENLIRPLTNATENGIVISVFEIDRVNGWVYFKAAANADDPYEHQLFRTNLDTPKIEQITKVSGVLDMFFKDQTDTLWVLRSELPATLQLDRYVVDGTYIDTPWEANPEVLSRHPIHHEYEWVLAADDSTRIEAMILKPADFDASQQYPVVEYIYGAPFSNVVVRNLLSNWLWDMNSLAHSGFVVVFVDGRGTEERGKEFQDHNHGKFGQGELADHVNAIKQLGASRSYMDLDRVGILGHSWGGHFALRALLEWPDFYKAGHINAAAIDPGKFRIAIEPFMGCSPEDCPEKYQKSAITPKLDQLEASLMIVHGTHDDDVPIEDSYELVRMLEELNYEKFEFVVYEGMDHIVMRNRGWKPQMIEFFESTLK